jgi:hypothetical protein
MSEISQAELKMMKQMLDMLMESNKDLKDRVARLESTNDGKPLVTSPKAGKDPMSWSFPPSENKQPDNSPNIQMPSVAELRSHMVTNDTKFNKI